MELKKKILIKRESLNNNNTQSVELNYKKIFDNIPDNYILQEGTEKYSVIGKEIVFTAEIYEKPNAPEFVETTIL